MKITVKADFAGAIAALDGLSRQVPYATAVALNKTAEWVQTDIRREMRRVFDRPTPWVLNALRIGPYANRGSLTVRVGFKDRSVVDSSSDMLTPHIAGGGRKPKAMESRLRRIGVLPAGWNAVPGAGASFDSYGNMSRGQVSMILNYLGSYTEAGFNTMQAKDRERKARGTKSKRGFVLFVAKPGNKAGLMPGVYKKTSFTFGKAITPLLMFVNRVNYKPRLDFFGIAQRTVEKRFPQEFAAAIAKAKATAFQGRG
jgi:hypothetical protein